MPASSVASVPNTQSTTPSGLARFEMRQPTASPGMAAGVKAGSTVKASEKRNCTAPNARFMAAAA